MKNILPLVLIVCCVCGCKPNTNTARSEGPASNSEKPGTAASAAIKIVGDTPDLALKTWWRVSDADLRYNYDQCLHYSTTMSPRNKYRDSIMIGQAKEYFSTKAACNLEHYSQTIEEVKVESDTRARIIATIRNDTPLDSSIHLDDSDIKSREKGETYRYLMERESTKDGWKVSQVERDYGVEIGGSRWSAEYKPWINKHTLIFNSQ